LSVEAGASFGWERYANRSVSIDTFGTSAPGQIALDYFGITPEHVVAEAHALVAARGAW
jgi:transketolase